MEITPERVKQFNVDGFVILNRILNDAQIVKVKNAMERVYNGEFIADLRPPEYRKPLPQFNPQQVNHYVHARLLDSDFWEVATDARIGEMAAKLLQTRSVSLIEDQLLAKPPGSKPIAMHQDYSYWKFSLIPQLTTCWIALTDMTLDMSPIQFIRGSHRWMTARTPTKFASGDEGDMMEIANEVHPPGAAVEIVTAIVPAGGGSFHHANALHGSQRNTSDRTRTAISLHYAAEECRADFRYLSWQPYMWEGVNVSLLHRTKGIRRIKVSDVQHGCINRT